MVLPEALPGFTRMEGPVAATLAGATARGLLWEADARRFLLHVPQVGRFLVEAGERITVDQEPGADEGEVERHLRMAPLAMLLAQRGVHALHAAAVSNGQGAVILGGASLTGKSTLAALLVQRGWSLLADELVLLDQGPGGAPRAWPTHPELMLWPDVLDRIQVRPGTVVRPAGRRRSLRCDGAFADGPVQVRAIHLLALDAKVGLTPLGGAQRFDALARAAYNPPLASVCFEPRAFAAGLARLPRNLATFRLSRPRAGWTAPELADLVEESCR